VGGDEVFCVVLGVRGWGGGREGRRGGGWFWGDEEELWVLPVRGGGGREGRRDCGWFWGCGCRCEWQCRCGVVCRCRAVCGCGIIVGPV